MIFPRDTNQLYKTGHLKPSVTSHTPIHDVPHPFRVSVHSAPSSCLRVNGAPDASPLQDFAIETDALLSYDSVHYQDYSVNRAPIHRAFRAQADISGYASEARHRHRYGRAQASLLSKRTHAFMART